MTTKATAKATPTKRVRRTKAQIEADRAAEEARRQELAAERAAKIPAPVSPKFSRTVHFLVDGYTALGRTWYYGQEVTITEGTKEFELAFDRNGNFIFDLDQNEQYERFGEVRYAQGPWPGLPYDENIRYEGDLVVDGKPIVPTPAEIEAIRKANRQRLNS